MDKTLIAALDELCDALKEKNAHVKAARAGGRADAFQLGLALIRLSRAHVVLEAAWQATKAAGAADER